MEKLGAMGYILIGFVILVIVKMYLDSDAYNLKCIVSTVDGNKYCVRERANLTAAADMLARTTEKMKRLTRQLHQAYPNRDNVSRLYNNFKPTRVKEILPTSEYTAYSENKGEQLALCLTNGKKGGGLIDENTLTFVALHELSHIMTKSIGHKQEFWDNFKFAIKEAAKIGIYSPVDYSKERITYCGMEISDNPYFS
jgi:hypothetical protein